jgi:hypothetical protein
VSTISSVPKGIWDFLNHAGEALKQATVCQTNDGVVVVPIQWDYVAWTPMTDRFITALKTQKFTSPVSGYSVILTGVVSPLTAQALDARGVNVTTKALPGPLQ